MKHKSFPLKPVLLALLYTLSGLLLTAGYILFISSQWAAQTYNVAFAELLYTLTTPLKGTGGDMINVVIENCLLPAIPLVLLYSICVIVLVFILPKQGKLLPFQRYFHIFTPALAVCVAVASVFSADSHLGIFDYVNAQLHRSTIYEDYFAEPSEISIQAPDTKKNLILIYLESMETSYASEEDGGYQAVNYMPYMTQLAKENISFSHTDRLGGFRQTGKTSWTMAALYATQSGMPFSFPIGGNDMGDFQQFAPNVTALGDILKNEGYVNHFLCGSDASFAGRRSFFETHGAYSIYDLYTAREQGVIPEDYFVFWGFEDHILYDIAKSELLTLARGDAPFNFTMLTVDPHHTGGYQCQYCQNEYENPTANVIRCADRQLESFLSWLKAQSFYEDSVIVLIGDHPRMDTALVSGIPSKERIMYNCFIHADAEVAGSLNHREMAPMDMFPTILSALGYRIEGDRLGLGTNLFSSRKTLTEELGYDYYCNELNKSSAYYEEHFY